MSLTKRSPPSSLEPDVFNEFLHTQPELSSHETSLKELEALDKTVWRKLDMRILPIATMFYLLSFLDRSNVANAKVAGMQKALKMTNHQYSIALTVTYVPYIFAELPSNLLLRIVGPDLMLPTMVTLWGLVATLQGVVHNYHGLLACRFFLGLLEGGLFPGLVLYLSFFYPRQRLNIRISTFFASASLSGAFSGLLAAAIMKLDGRAGRPGWAWIFILEGIFTFLFGAFSYLVLPRSPAEARFLTDREKSFVDTRLRADGVLSKDADDDNFSWVEIGRAFLLPQVWFLAIAFFFDGTTLYGMAYFEPTIVQGFGYTSTRTQLMSVPPFATAFVVGMVVAFISDRFRCRGLMSMFASGMCIAGYSLFLATDSNKVRYGSLFLTIPGTYTAAPTMSAWNANNTAPHVRRATAVAIGFIMTNSGGILATWLLGSLSPPPKYTKATITFVVMSIGMFVFAGINLVYLHWQNTKKAKKREESEKDNEPRGLGDRSAWFIYSL